jgi:hypothetical protein
VLAEKVCDIRRSLVTITGDEFLFFSHNFNVIVCLNRINYKVSKNNKNNPKCQPISQLFLLVLPALHILAWRNRVEVLESGGETSRGR